MPSVVIPTLGREDVLVDTIRALTRCEPPPEEIIVVDQTPVHDVATEASLRSWDASGTVSWIRLPEPSITRAMNTGVAAAKSEVVLFVDDDIVPSSGLVGAHAMVYGDDKIVAVAGQVLQPGEEPEPIEPARTQGLRADLGFPFRTTTRCVVANVMAGNLSVRRQAAIAAGGFDENFVGSAYRFETEFARRLVRHGGTIRFEPSASIRHLRAERGGTRAKGGHMASGLPLHGVGDYYFALTQGVSWETIRYMARRPFREVRTRFHLRHPWWIPVKFVGELRALLLAVRLWRKGPKLGFPIEERRTDVVD